MQRSSGGPRPPTLCRYAALKVRGAVPRGPDTRRVDGGTGTPPARRTRHRDFFLSLKRLSLPRKEVIQPHVPVRLPCYDFTPLTLHTFGASPPRGLGRRLRVQTTRVV